MLNNHPFLIRDREKMATETQKTIKRQEPKRPEIIKTVNLCTL